jgi:hypothetical protein
VIRLTRVAVTRWEFEPKACGVAVPVFGPGGEVVAALELTVGDLGRDLHPAMTALSIASRSLSREIVGDARRGPSNESAVRLTPQKGSVGFTGGPSLVRAGG